MSTRFSTAVRRLALAGAVVFATDARAAPQQPAEMPQAIQPGEIAENVQSRHAADQSFAVYLPSTYTAERTWPVLFLMDPRGRALVPLELFRPAAERLGYVLVSSYNTSSDAPEDVNTPALEAMLTDSTRLLRLDNRRFYLGGFSGTARSAWAFAQQLQSFVAGIVGFGGGLPSAFVLPEEAPYAYYGVAGTTDFNYEEMRDLDRRLDEGRIEHRFDYFFGGHAWGPEEVCARALEWMELMAMKTRLRTPDGTLAVDLYVRRLLEAQALESRADAYEAWRHYAELLVDFEGVIGPSELASVADRVRALADLDEVAATIDLADRLSSQHRTYVSVLRSIVERLRAESRLPSAAELIGDLDLAEIKLRAADVSSPMAAQAAQRLIETVFVQVAFYQPRDFLAQGKSVAALELLEVADFIRPDNVGVLLFQARAHAQNGDGEQAVTALDRARTLSELDPDAIDDDPYFDSIRQTPSFRALMARLRESARSQR